MAKISKSKVTVFLDLSDYDGYDKIKKKSAAKEEIGRAVIDGMIENLSRAVSPVSGGSYKQTLSPQYAKKKGRNMADLNLEGDLWNSFEFRQKGRGIEVGVFDKSEAPKAFNHQRGDTLPTRQYLPEGGQKFKRNIESEIKRIIKDYHGSKSNSETER